MTGGSVRGKNQRFPLQHNMEKPWTQMRMLPALWMKRMVKHILYDIGWLFPSSYNATVENNAFVRGIVGSRCKQDIGREMACKSWSPWRTSKCTSQNSYIFTIESNLPSIWLINCFSFFHPSIFYCYNRLKSNILKQHVCQPPTHKQTPHLSDFSPLKNLLFFFKAQRWSRTVKLANFKNRITFGIFDQIVSRPQVVKPYSWWYRRKASRLSYSAVRKGDMLKLTEAQKNPNQAQISGECYIICQLQLHNNSHVWWHAKFLKYPRIVERYVNQFALCRPSKRACFLEPLNVQTQTVSNRRNINKIISRRTHSTSFDLIRLPKPCTFKNLSFTISSLLLVNPRCWTSTVSFCCFDVVTSKWSSPMGWSCIAFSGCPFSKIIRQLTPHTHGGVLPV